MPTLADLMLQGGPGVKLHEEAKKRRSTKRVLGPLNRSRLISHFNERMRLEDYGEPSPLTKEDYNMINGVVKLFNVNDVDPKEVFDFVGDLVHYWNKLRNMETVTLKGKNWVLNVRPSLRDIVICRESLLANLNTVKSTEAKETAAIEKHISTVNQSDSLDIPEPIKPKKKKSFRPTQAEIDAAYERLQDE